MGTTIQAFDIFQTPLSSHYPLPLRSSRPQEIFQPPQQGFYSTHAHAVAASQKYFSAIHTSPHLTLAFVNNIILHLLLVLCTAVNVWNKN